MMTRVTRVRTRTAPPRPRWSWLYGAVILISGLGVIAHVLIDPGVLRHVGDAACVLTLLGALGGWVRMNRVELARVSRRLYDIESIVPSWMPGM